MFLSFNIGKVIPHEFAVMKEISDFNNNREILHSYLFFLYFQSNHLVLSEHAIMKVLIHQYRKKELLPSLPPVREKERN